MSRNESGLVHNYSCNQHHFSYKQFFGWNQSLQKKFLEETIEQFIPHNSSISFDITSNHINNTFILDLFQNSMKIKSITLISYPQQSFITDLFYKKSFQNKFIKFI